MRNELTSQLVNLYREKNIPLRKLALRFNISRYAIRKILCQHHIPIRNSRSALIAMGHIKEKVRFSLPSQEKAYLFGLVMGDLTPIKKSSYTLRLITHTTHTYFRDLLWNTFKKYGPVSANINKKGEYRFVAYLDYLSFLFLLETKTGKIPSWLSKKYFYSFLAGFIDSDGSVLIRKSGRYFQYVIRFFSENLDLLLNVKNSLESLNYHLSIHKNHSKGEVHYHRGIKFQYNHDYYTLEVYRRQETLNLLKIIPLRHPEKIMKKNLIFSVEKRGLYYWDEVKTDINELRSKIQSTVLSASSEK